MAPMAASAILLAVATSPAVPRSALIARRGPLARPCFTRMGFLDSFFRPPRDSAGTAADAEAERRRRYPEQYPAVVDAWADPVPEDALDPTGLAAMVRPLLLATQLERRPLRIAFDACREGWRASAFHAAVDGQGAAVVVARARGDDALVGGYNPKGWASMGGARPSVAAFLFRLSPSGARLPNTSATAGPEASSTARPSEGGVKVRKVGGGGNAVSSDDPATGIAFGVDAFVVPFAGDSTSSRRAVSRLGSYFEPLPSGVRSLLPGGRSSVELESLVVLTGVYAEGEEIPYSGAVMDMTSG